MRETRKKDPLPPGRPRFFCEGCGAEVPRDASRCPGCGKSFSQVKCPACGFTGEEGLFQTGCPVCGYSAPPGPRGASWPGRKRTPPLPDAPPPAAALPSALYLLILAIVLLVLALLVFFFVF